RQTRQVTGAVALDPVAAARHAAEANATGRGDQDLEIVRIVRGVHESEVAGPAGIRAPGAQQPPVLAAGARVLEEEGCPGGRAGGHVQLSTGARRANADIAAGADVDAAGRRAGTDAERQPRAPGAVPD